MVVIIDNYDSFTYNLAHLVKELGVAVDVLRNDQFSIEELEQYDKIILSPGPGVPEEAGLLLDVIRTYAGKKPILGVCLGEQAIGPEGQIMALKHREYDVRGIQFHPESVLTPDGKQIMKNWLEE